MTAPYLIGGQADISGSALSTTTVVVGQVNGSPSGSPTSAGDWIFVGIDVSGSAPVTGVTDSKGNTYAAVPGATSAQNNLIVYAATGATAALTTSDTIVVSWGSTGGAKSAYAVAVPGATAVDQVASATGTGTNPSVTSGTLSTANQSCLAFESSGSGGGAITWTSPWVNTAPGIEVGSTQWLAVASQVVSSTAPVTASGTISSSSWGLVIITVETTIPPVTGTGGVRLPKPSLALSGAMSVPVSGSGGVRLPKPSLALAGTTGPSAPFRPVNTWYLVSENSLGIDPLAIGNTAGNTLIAFCVAGSSFSQMPVFSIADDANNVWRPYSRHTFGDRILEIWVSPNARAASFVSVGTSWPSQAVLAMVAEFSGFPDFASVNIAVSNSSGSGTSLSLSAVATAPTFAVSLFAVSDQGGAVPTITGPGAGWFGTFTLDTGNPTATSLSQTIAYNVGTFNSAGTVSASWGQSGPAAELAGLLVCFTQAPASPFQPNANRPALKVEAAFGFQPGIINAVPAWTDITTYCIAEDGTQGITTSRGREYELTEAEAGEITILVNNLDGTFNPENTASVFWPNVTLEIPVRVSAVWDNVTYPIAFGYITSLPQQFPDPQWGFVPIRANDGVSILSNITMPSALGGEILADGPYLYIPFTEFYNAAAGEPFDNASRTNLKAAVGYNGNLDANVLQTGLTLNLAGDPGTGIGIDGLSSSSITRLPGARYLDYDLPAPANGCTLEIAAVVGLPPSGTTYLNLLALEGPAGNYFPVSSINQPAAPPYAQPNWRMGLVLTQDHAATNGYNLFIQGFAQSTFQHSGTASVSFMDGNPHWHSVTLNWNGSNWVVAYYIDGNQQFSATTSGVGQFGRVNAITTGPCQTYCATTNVGGYNYATGQLAYTGAVLSQARIQAHATAALTGFSGDIVSERFARHLTWAGLGLPRAGDAGSSSPLIGHADQVQGQSVADAANDLVTDDGGMWFCDAQGNNWIRSRQSLYNKNTRWIFGDNPSAGECPYEPDAEFGFDNSFLYNQTSSVRTISTGNEYLVAGNGAADKVTVNNTGATAEAADVASEQQYFPHGPLEQDIETTSDQDAYDRASWSLVKYRQPVIRASKITLSPASNPAVWPVALGIEQGDIALVNRRPIGAVPYSVLCIVQKVEHAIEPSNWTVDVTLAPYFPDNTVLQASATGFDALASPNVLGW